MICYVKLIFVGYSSVITSSKGLCFGCVRLSVFMTTLKQNDCIFMNFDVVRASPKEGVIKYWETSQSYYRHKTNPVSQYPVFNDLVFVVEFTPKTMKSSICLKFQYINILRHGRRYVLWECFLVGLCDIK